MDDRVIDAPAAVTTATLDWRLLYRAAGIAAVSVLAFMVIQIAVFVMWPPPADAEAWFQLFGENHLIGLLDMDLLLIVDYVLLALVNLAIAVALWRAEPALSAIGALAAFLGLAAYFASMRAFEMMALSDQLAAATTEAARSEIMAAGRLAVAAWTGTAFNTSYVLGAVSVLAFSLAMLRSTVFSRATGYAGLVAGVFMVVPPTVGPIGLAMSLASLIPTVVWLVLLMRQFFAMANVHRPMRA